MTLPMNERVVVKGHERSDLGAIFTTFLVQGLPVCNFRNCFQTQKKQFDNINTCIPIPGSATLCVALMTIKSNLGRKTQTYSSCRLNSPPFYLLGSNVDQVRSILPALELLPLDWSCRKCDKLRGSNSNAGKMDQA